MSTEIEVNMTFHLRMKIFATFTSILLLKACSIKTSIHLRTFSQVLATFIKIF